MKNKNISKKNKSIFKILLTITAICLLAVMIPGTYSSEYISGEEYGETIDEGEYQEVDEMLTEEVEGVLTEIEAEYQASEEILTEIEDEYQASEAEIIEIQPLQIQNRTAANLTQLRTVITELNASPTGTTFDVNLTNATLGAYDFDVTGTQIGSLTINAGRTLIIRSNVGATIRTRRTPLTLPYHHFVVHGVLVMEDGVTLTHLIILEEDPRFVSGGGVRVDFGGNFIMNGGTITDIYWSQPGICPSNVSTIPGGASGAPVLICEHGTFELNAGEIIDNYGMRGGGVFAHAHATFIMRGGRIHENRGSTRGGGVIIYGRFEMEGGEISYNRCGRSPGGGGFGGAGVYVTGNGYFVMSGGEIFGNRTYSPAGQNISGGGGGVLLDDHAEFLMTGSAVIRDNFTNYKGGGIATGRVEGSQNHTTVRVTIEGNARIEGNEGPDGGGIFVRADTRLTMSEDWTGEIYNNLGGTGGGISSLNGIVVMNGGVIRGNRAVSGAGVSNLGGVIRGERGFTMNNDSMIVDNIATGAGFGVGVQNQGGRFDMNDNATIRGNRGGNNLGGGVWTGDWGATVPSTFTMRDNATISDNTAASGGGIHVGHGSINGVVIMGSEHGNDTVAIYDNVSRGTGDSGGGVFLTPNTQFTMNSGTIRDNTATGRGGGVQNNGGNFTMNRGEIRGNSARNGGGGVYSIGTGVNGFTMNNDALIVGNEVTISLMSTGGNGLQSGGGGVRNQGRFDMNDHSAIRGNHAIVYENTIHPITRAHGGGVFHQSGTFTMNDYATIGGLNSADANTAAYHGGGVFINGGIFTLGTRAGVRRIQNNQALDGGGVYLANGTFNFGSAGTRHIQDNIARNNGGGIYRGGLGTFIAGTGARHITGNTAAHSGGGIQWVATDATFNTGMTISNNTAIHNGGGMNILAGHVTLDAVQVRNNRAATGTNLTTTTTGYGGGVRVAAYPARLSVNGGDFTGNHAGRDGGGIWTGTHDYVRSLPTDRRPAPEPQAPLPTSYGNLITASNVAFTGNSAGLGSFVPPSNWNITEVRGNGTSPAEVARQVNPLNNYDVNFRGVDDVDFEFIKISGLTEGPLEFAAFSLYARNATNSEWVTPARTATSGADGRVVFTGLTPGRQYRLIETDASSGYITPTGHWIVSVALDGTIDIEAFGENQPEFEDQDDIWFLTNDPRPEMDFIFTKTDSSIYDLNLPIASVTRLPGAVFRLERYTPNPDVSTQPGTWTSVGEATSGANGVVRFENAVTANALYRLTEIEAPTGFILPNGYWHFRFNGNGDVQTNYPRAYGGWVLAFRYVEDYTEDSGMWFVGNMFDIELPATGGIGTTNLLILGTLTLGGVYVLWLRKKVKDKLELEGI